MARYRRARSKVASAPFFAAIILLAFAGIVSSFFPLINSSADLLFKITPYIAGAIILCGIIITVYIDFKEKKRVRALQIADIDKMTGIEFEQYVGALLKSQGYGIQFTPASGDYGTDIIATKGDRKIAVQIKRYSSKIGPPAIQQAVTSIAVYKCTSSMVVTNSYFTREAKSMAEYNNCELIDRDKLADWVVEFQRLR